MSQSDFSACDGAAMHERLISAYQEVRELNDEMEGLVKDALTN